MSNQSLPTEGSIEIRVRYCECDPMSLAHHGSYAAWFEMGRTELLRQSGITYKQLEEEGLYLAIVRLEIRFKKPVIYDDVITIVTRLEDASRVKLTHHYEVRRGGTDGELLTTARTVLAAIDGEGHPRALPDWLTRLEIPG